MIRQLSRLGLLLIPLAAGPASAEWVTERLYLGLYAQPDTNASPLQMLPTGEQVEVLQRQGDFVQLELEDGTQGWARADFIAEQPPANVRLEEVTAERDRARRQLEQVGDTEQEINQLQQKLAQANSTVARLRNELESEEEENAQQASEAVENRDKRIDTLQSKLEQARQQAADLESEKQALEERVERAGQRTDNMLLKIVWVLASMLVCLIIGAVLGARWMAARVRRRFNGLKVW